MALPRGTTNRRDVERLVTKFCACLRDNVRIEPQRRAASSSIDGYPNEGAGGDLPWLCIRFDDELTRQSDSRWRRVREKLEAVSILSAAACCRAYSLQNNPQFWRQFLEDQCCVRSTEAFIKCLGKNTAMRTKMPMFLLDFSFMDVTPDLLKLCRSFLTARRKAKKCMRINYVEAMTQLEAVTKQQQRGYGLQPEKIQIGFILNRCGLQTPAPKSQAGDAPAGTTHVSSVQLLQEIISDIVMRATAIERLQSSSSYRNHHQQQEQSNVKILDVDPTAWGFFYFEVSVLDMSATELVRKDFARIAQMVADPAGRLCELVLNKIISNASEQQYASSFGTLMSECFAAEIDTSSHPEPEAEAQALSGQFAPPNPAKRAFLERFTFDWNALNLNRLSSLFSAIHCSSRAHQSVRNLSLIGSFRRFDGDPTLPRAWLAYGVFHPSSNSQIQSLDLSSNTLCHDDVNAMRRVLTMENYREELLGLEVLYSEKNRVIVAAPEAATQPYSAVRLKKQANLWPTNNASDKVLLQLNDESAWFEVFQHGTRWTCVLVPGYGVLWTRTKMVLKIEQRERQLSNTKRTPLKQLMLNSMVGKESERINHVFRELLPLVGGSLVHLELRSNPLSNISLAAIMSSCPNLKFLDICACELQTIAAIMDSYERGQCRVSTLLLAENHIHEREVRRLCALLLRDPTDVANSAAANLRCLDVDQNPIGRPGLVAIGKVLASSRVLQSIVLSRSEDPDGQLRGRFAIHEDEFLGIAPLQLPQRLATLSAALMVPAMNAVDIPVMKAVFAFAGTFVYRKVVWNYFLRFFSWSRGLINTDMNIGTSALVVSVADSFLQQRGSSSDECDDSRCSDRSVRGSPAGWRWRWRRRVGGCSCSRTRRRGISSLDGPHRITRTAPRSTRRRASNSTGDLDAVLLTVRDRRVHELTAQRNAALDRQRAIHQVEREDRPEQRDALGGLAHARELRVCGRVVQGGEDHGRLGHAERHVRVLREHFELRDLTLGHVRRRGDRGDSSSSSSEGQLHGGDGCGL